MIGLFQIKDHLKQALFVLPIAAELTQTFLLPSSWHHQSPGRLLLIASWADCDDATGHMQCNKEMTNSAFTRRL